MIAYSNKRPGSGSSLSVQSTRAQDGKTYCNGRDAHSGPIHYSESSTILVVNGGTSITTRNSSTMQHCSCSAHRCERGSLTPTSGRGFVQVGSAWPRPARASTTVTNPLPRPMAHGHRFPKQSSIAEMRNLAAANTLRCSVAARVCSKSSSRPRGTWSWF